MDKLQKTAIKLAEEEGLKVLGMTYGGKHRYLVVSNSLGWTMSETLHTGNNIGASSLRNLKADFKRFARGDTHNLKHIMK